MHTASAAETTTATTTATTKTTAATATRTAAGSTTSERRHRSYTERLSAWLRFNRRLNGRNKVSCKDLCKI